MPSSQTAANERRNERTITHEPPKLKTTLKTPPKQATNPLQFVKVGPCSLYRTAQEQLQKVQEVKKIKQTVRDDPEDWQSNLDNWKSSRRKRQEHIIERVVEVKKLELEEHDRQRRRSKTFSEMMEERGNRGRKLSMSLAMYHEEDSNDLSDLGIGTSSGKSSISGDTHDDAQSVLSDRDSEVDKNHSDVDTAIETSNVDNNNVVEVKKISTLLEINKKHDCRRPEKDYNDEKYSESTCSPRKNVDYTHEKSNVVQTRNFLDNKHDLVKVDVLKRREIFEMASQTNDNVNNSINNFIKDKLSSLDTYKNDVESIETNKTLKRLSGDMSSVRDRLSQLEREATEREKQQISQKTEKIETIRPLKDRLLVLEKNHASTAATISKEPINKTTEISELTLTINDCLSGLTDSKSDDLMEKCTKNINDKLQDIKLTERCSSPEIDYHATRAVFHRSLDSLDVVGSNEPNTFERVQSFEELNYNRMRYFVTAASGEILNDTDREDSGIQTADVSCSVSQADEPVDEDPSQNSLSVGVPIDEINHSDSPSLEQQHRILNKVDANEKTEIAEKYQEKVDVQLQTPVIIEGTAETTGNTLTNKFQKISTSYTIIYQTPQVPPRKTPPELLSDKNSVKIDPVKLEKNEKTIEIKPSPTLELTNLSINKPSRIPTALSRKPINTKIQMVSGSPSKSSKKYSFKFSTPSSPASFHKTTSKCPSSASISPVTTLTATKISVDEQVPASSEEPIVIVNSEHEETVARSKSPTSVELEEVVETSQPAVDIACYDLPVPCPNNTEPTPPVVSLRPKPSQLKPSLHLDQPCDNLPVVMEFIDTSVTLSQPISPFNLDNNEEIVAGITFSLGPPTSVEPPKEKPPPPPTDISDDENPSIEPLKRLNSTRRIKKELRTRRSDFLGIEGINDYDLELNLTKPPDIAAILAEERRIEQLHRRSYDTDSNYEQDSSHERDSGVELGHAEEWTKQPVSPDMSQHSRQSSEPFGASVTSSEEDEITKKEREIIEVLEREEAWRYGSDREQNSDIGEKLAHKLRELEEEKMQLERERAQEDENVRKNDEDVMLLQKQPTDAKQQEVERTNDMKFRMNDIAIKLEQLRLKNDDQIALEEKTTMATMICEHEDDYSCGEVRRVERELLQLEQEELKRQRTNTAYRETKQQQFIQLTDPLQEQWPSLQNINDMSNMAYATYENISIVNLRASMPNLQLQDSQRRRPPPPPIPPAKPLRLIDQRQRDLTIRNSRIPSADSIPQQMDGTSTSYHNVSSSMTTQPGQQMSKQTLQALSAVPRPRIFKGDQWVQRRRSDGVQVTQDLNYQHWLIQEAELRRINEKHQRSSSSSSSYATKPLHHATGTSVPYSPASSIKSEGKPLPDSIIQTLTQRMHNRAQERPATFRKRAEYSISQEHLPLMHHPAALEHHVPMHQSPAISNNTESQDKMLSVSGKKKCSHCCDELGRGAAMIIESLRLFYHMECFKCCVCHVRLGDGRMGTDVRVRNHKLHCHNCYSSDDGVKFSCV